MRDPNHAIRSNLLSYPRASLFSAVQGSYDMTAELQRDDLNADSPWNPGLRKQAGCGTCDERREL
jgi:hypothetical protein